MHRERIDGRPCGVEAGGGLAGECGECRNASGEGQLRNHHEYLYAQRGTEKLLERGDLVIDVARIRSVPDAPAGHMDVVDPGLQG